MVGLEYPTRFVDMLDWGRLTYQNVPVYVRILKESSSSSASCDVSNADVDNFLEDDEKHPSFLEITRGLVLVPKEDLYKMFFLRKMRVLTFEKKCEQAVNGGRLTLSDIVKPGSIVSLLFELHIHSLF